MDSKISIGTLELLIDAPFAEAEAILRELCERMIKQFALLGTPYVLEFEKVSVKPHCIRAKYIVLIGLLSGAAAAAPDFVKDYPEIKKGLSEIVQDATSAYSFIRDYVLRLDRALYGPVKKGENLTLILRHLAVPETQWNSAIKELVRRNPAAFIDGNPNCLKEGAVLVLPSFG